MTTAGKKNVKKVQNSAAIFEDLKKLYTFCSQEDPDNCITSSNKEFGGYFA